MPSANTAARNNTATPRVMAKDASESITNGITAAETAEYIFSLMFAPGQTARVNSNDARAHITAATAAINTGFKKNITTNKPGTATTPTIILVFISSTPCSLFYSAKSSVTMLKFNYGIVQVI